MCEGRDWRRGGAPPGSGLLASVVSERAARLGDPFEPKERLCQQRAAVFVAAVGWPRFIRGAWLKPGAVVIDAGYNDRNVGDVEFDEALRRASLLTSVPGGVGPMTMAVLLHQTVNAAEALTRSHPAG